MESLIEKLGGRKSFIALLALLLGTVVEFVKPGGLSESYVMMLASIVGIFSGANALVSWKGLQVGEQEAAAAPKTEGASETDELVLKTDYVARSLESVQAEQQVQAEALQKMTGLIKGLLTIK